MITTGRTVGVAEGIIDDMQCLVSKLLFLLHLCRGLADGYAINGISLVNHVYLHSISG